MSERLRGMLAARLARPQRLLLSGSAAEVDSQFDAWCRDHRGSAVELLVGLPLLHELVVEPGLPLADAAALRGYAQQQFAHYFGAVAQRFALAPWQAGDARGVSALHGLDPAALQARAAAAGVRLVALRPAWAAWLAALPAEQRAGSGRLVWHEGERALVITLERGQVRALQLRRVASLADLGEGALLALGTPAHELQPQPGPAVPQPDFLAQGPRPSPLAWPLAATGALVLATAGWSSWQSHAQLQLAQDARGRVQALRPAPVVKAVARRSAEPENRAAQEARMLLATSWEPVLSRVETVGAEAKTIAWLGLDANAGRGELRLEGLTPDKLLALQLAEQLGTTPGWGQVVLSRFSAAETGLTGQRFEINAKFRPENGS
ncbi:MAG: hypothetical protein DI603_08590 [Roseateles depolymerans]|uniref:Uncharacterized protein n=1 Tax=Roseateles depolymerans TaxID=76731 RepID=A0A2W5FKI2_9BURK|nr:MAG: hypothetical protein DI603_08590 [Roseateles depolymerans]PZR24938.1 MAG: hypothetical protein DI538_27770 [Azospira oryzae]